jgi:hypothetical protein
MPAIKHMAMGTNNNRRLARFYQLIPGMRDVWNIQENSSHLFCVTLTPKNLSSTSIR